MQTINASIRTSAVITLHDAHTGRSFGAVSINGREATISVNDGIDLASALTMLELVYFLNNTKPDMPDHFNIIDNDVAYGIVNEPYTMTVVQRNRRLKNGCITTWTTYHDDYTVRAKAYII